MSDKKIFFVKAHACGNDFLVVEESAAGEEHAQLARKLCARNTSVGADGIEFLERKPDGSFFLRLFNADGSEAELSGNGTRCVAAWLALSEKKNEVVLGTHGGPRKCKVIEARGEHFLIESGMGVPQVKARTIAVAGVGAVEGAEVNVGNPHFVIFVESADFRSHGLQWEQMGALICTDAQFPQGTNVEFVRVLGKDKIEFRIYERGVGPTASSGTGTCASAAAAMVLRGTQRELTSVAQGGVQRVVWPADGKPMLLTGPAEVICTGEVFAL
jgi:diaminopimelate epimerase